MALSPHDDKSPPIGRAASPIKALLARWRLIALAILVGGLISTATAFMVEPQYRVEIVVIPVAGKDSAGALGEMLGPLGNLASLANVGLGGDSGKQEALEYLQSRKFAEAFIQERALMPELFKKRWSQSEKQWIGPAPTTGDAVRFFKKRVLSIVQDKRTGVLRVGVTFSDRNVAAQWANSYIQDANRDLRLMAAAEAQRSTEYLKQELGKTNVVGVEQAIYRLIEAQISKTALASARPEYAFKIIDPAVVPDADKFVAPNRPLMVFSGVLIGAIAAAGYALSRSYSWDV